MTVDKKTLLQKNHLSKLYYILPKISSRGQILWICWHPEDSGRFPEACPEAYMFFKTFTTSSQFRKVSGSLSGSLLLFCLAFCNSGRFRKIPGSLSGSLFEHFDLLHSGSFRKVSGRPTGRSTKHQVLFLGL